MVTAALVRRLAQSLPGTVEVEHHGFPSFRVAGRIFATLPTSDRLRAMLVEHGVRAAAANRPECCREFYWGKRLACVEIDLEVADEILVGDLLADAWERKSTPAG
jgi:hypothetical protein